MRVKNQANLHPDRFADVEAEIQGHCKIEDILKWGFAQDRGSIHPQVIAEVVTQDEFTHDLIVPWRDGLVLVYGAT